MNCSEATLVSIATGELQCSYCGDIMAGNVFPKHKCEESEKAWDEWLEENLHAYD